ncbi:MAG TPA: hypothetical protein VKR23_03825 [Gaiellaceae bacterium]|nr:hypothetical protein [Gaiellaceae bacterium]
MTMRLVRIAALITIAGVAAMPAAAAGRRISSCGAKPDAHDRWAVVFGTEPTLAKADKTLALVHAKGFSAHIEVDSCTVYEVEQNGYRSSAAVAAALTKARAAGFSAKREDS